MSRVDEEATLTISDLEQMWRGRVAQVSLLAELEVDTLGISAALRLVGREWNSHWPEKAARRIAARYPAVFVAALSGAASLHYEAGALWPAVWRSAGVYGDADTARAWGQLFERCLQRLELTTFPELAYERSMRYLTRILLHAGIPIYSLGDWLDVIDATARQLQTGDSTAIFDSLRSRAVTGRLTQVDKPVERFIRLGGDYALDFLDRSLELLRSLQQGAGAPDGLGLPKRFVDEARSCVREAATPVPSFDVGRVDRRPVLMFDPHGIGVHLMLPPVARDTPLRWVVAMDGDEQEVLAAPSSSGTTDVIKLPVPARVARIEIRADEVATSFRIDDGALPLLLFGKDGAALPATGTVRATQVWALHPTDATLREGAGRIIERLPSVHRWDGWSATLIELAGASSVGLSGGRSRAVGASGTPCLETEAMPHVRGVDGNPVYDGWPQLSLPAAATGDQAWIVRLDMGTSDLSTSTTHEARADGASSLDLGSIAPLDGGTVDLVVRGPLGRGLKTSFIVAPRLSASSTPVWRSFADGGLAPAIARVTHPDGTCEAVELGVDQRDLRTALDLATGLVDVIFTPPAMASQLVHDGVPIQWTHATRYLVTEELLENPGQLVVRYDPDGAAPALEAIDAHSNLLQRVEGAAGRCNGKASFNLARLTDTLRVAGACTLLLRTPDRRDRVAVVRPAQLATDVAVRATGDALQLVGATATEQLTAGIYRHLDPLTEPTVLTVETSGTILLPDQLLTAGSLRVLLRIDDPWVPAPWPAFPPLGGNSFDVVRAVAAEPFTPLHRLLATAEIDSSVDLLRDAIAVYPMLDRLLTPADTPLIRSVIRGETQRDPHRTAWAIGIGATSVRDAAFMSVNLGVANRPLGTFSPEEVELLLDRWAPLGVAAATPYVRCAGEASWVTALVVDRVGEAFADLLESRSDVALLRPVFQDAHLAELPPEVLDVVFRQAGIVPSLLLEADAQALAGRALLTAIQDRGGALQPLQGDWENLVGTTLASVLERKAPQRLVHATKGRVQGAGWQAAPAASLALATVARLDARLPEGDQRLRNGWRFALGRLARAVPNLVAADLVMAEAVLLSEEA